MNMNNTLNNALYNEGYYGSPNGEGYYGIDMLNR